MKKEYRIKKESDFDKIIRKKNSFANKHFVAYFMENKENEHFRLGISVSKKLGKAHKRNKLKRYVRQFFTDNKEFIKTIDIVIIVRNNAVDIPFEEFCKSLNHILIKTNLRRRKKKND